MCGIWFFKQEPSHVRVEESTFYTVWIFIGINIAMMGPVVATPFFDGVLSRASADNRKNQFQEWARSISSVCPEAMITC
jgi:hypothetical protein